MSQLLSLGAIEKSSGIYVYPSIANKKETYICPDCSEELILCQGKIRIHHFRHKIEKDKENPCNYYNKPTESQIHRNAKMLLKALFDNGNKVTITKKCSNQYCGNCDNLEIQKTEQQKVQLEYRFNFNESIKIADVALLENGLIIYIFEICYKHKTADENRPEPWFEIGAIDLLNMVNSFNMVNSDCNFSINCIRGFKCKNCVLFEKAAEENKLRAQKKEELRLIQLENAKLKEKLNCIALEKIKKEEEKKLLELRLHEERLKKEKMIEYSKLLLKKVIEKSPISKEEECSQCRRKRHIEIKKPPDDYIIDFADSIKLKGRDIIINIAYINLENVNQLYILQLDKYNDSICRFGIIYDYFLKGSETILACLNIENLSIINYIEIERLCNVCLNKNKKMTHKISEYITNKKIPETSQNKICCICGNWVFENSSDFRYNDIKGTWKNTIPCIDNVNILEGSSIPVCSKCYQTKIKNKKRSIYIMGHEFIIKDILTYYRCL